MTNYARHRGEGEGGRARVVWQTKSLTRRRKARSSFSRTVSPTVTAAHPSCGGGTGGGREQ
jgi:hypothetical protein